MANMFDREEMPKFRRVGSPAKICLLAVRHFVRSLEPIPQRRSKSSQAAESPVPRAIRGKWRKRDGQNFAALRVADVRYQTNPRTLECGDNPTGGRLRQTARSGTCDEVIRNNG
jgi:hypothetical protein